MTAETEDVADAVARIRKRIGRYEEGLRVKSFEVGDYPISDDHAADLKVVLATIERLREENARVVADLPDDECGICGKARSQHTTNSGVGMCQLYPMFRSKREMARQWFAALTPSADDDK